MNKNYYAVIMAGGVGTRFWPMSTQEYPKQFHDMLGTGNSLIQKTFSRLERLIPTENILISTNKRYKKLVLEQLENTTPKQLLLEPCMRNTSPCILYAALKIHAINPEGVMIIHQVIIGLKMKLSLLIILKLLLSFANKMMC